MTADLEPGIWNCQNCYLHVTGKSNTGNTPQTHLIRYTGAKIAVKFKLVINDKLLQNNDSFQCIGVNYLSTYEQNTANWMKHSESADTLR